MSYLPENNNAPNETFFLQGRTIFMHRDLFFSDSNRVKLIEEIKSFLLNWKHFEASLWNILRENIIKVKSKKILSLFLFLDRHLNLCTPTPIARFTSNLFCCCFFEHP